MFKGHLPQHMRTHSAIKTHGCLTCKALFSQRSQVDYLTFIFRSSNNILFLSYVSQLIVHQRIHRYDYYFINVLIVSLKSFSINYLLCEIVAASDLIVVQVY